MQLVVIGDLHGRKTGLEIAQKHPEDILVFLGDYFDSKTSITASEQLTIFETLIKLKLKKPEKVVLLTGNHDIHYIRGATQQYTGYQWLHATDIIQKITMAYRQGLLQAAYSRGSFLMVHAGLTRTWCGHWGIDLHNPVEEVNALFSQSLRPFEFIYKPGCNKTGDDIHQGPFWVRPASLQADAIAGFTQVIGHTQFNQPQVWPGIIALDVLSFCRKYLIINQKGIATLADI